MPQILDGKVASAKIYETIAKGQKFSSKPGTLAIVTIGNDEASKVYVNSKKAKALACGFKFQHIQLSENITYKELEETVNFLNKNTHINGIIIQKPLPKHLAKWDSLIDTLVDPNKDVDGFHPMSDFESCTPKGIIKLLDVNEVPYEGKFVVIAGRSKIVSQPLAKMFMDKNCTVVMIHSKTPKDLVEKLIKECDIFVSAIGSKYHWTEYLFRDSKPKIALVDVGINREYDEELKKNRIFGDIHPDCYKYSDYYTPVPGGVGLMTVAMLMTNLNETN